MDQVIGIVLIHFYLFEDDAALAGYVFRAENRVQDQVTQDIHGQRKVLVQNFDVEADAFFGGEGVHVAADGIDLTGDGFGGARFGALEDHVLDEMGDAVPLGRFVAGAGLQPDSDGDGTNVRHLLGDYGQAVRKHLTTDVACFFYHWLAFLEFNFMSATQ